MSLQTDDVTVAGTHLNVCAILSKLDKHDKARLKSEKKIGSHHVVIGMEKRAKFMENVSFLINYANLSGVWVHELHDGDFLGFFQRWASQFFFLIGASACSMRPGINQKSCGILGGVEFTGRGG